MKGPFPLVSAFAFIPTWCFPHSGQSAPFKTGVRSGSTSAQNPLEVLCLPWSKIHSPDNLLSSRPHLVSGCFLPLLSTVTSFPDGLSSTLSQGCPKKTCCWNMSLLYLTSSTGWNLYQTNIYEISLFHPSKNFLFRTLLCWFFCVRVEFITNKYTVYLIVYMLFFAIFSYLHGSSMSSEILCLVCCISKCLEQWQGPNIWLKKKKNTRNMWVIYIQVFLAGN